MKDNRFQAVAKAYREDRNFRAEVEANAKAALTARGFAFGREEVRVAVDTGDTVHIVFPPNPNGTLTDEELEIAVGGSTYWPHNGRWLSYAEVQRRRGVGSSH